MGDKSMRQAEAVRRGYRHKNLLFWLGMIDALMDPVLPCHHVIDWGCGHGLFLQLLYEIAPYRSAVGVDRDRESLKIARDGLGQKHPEWPIRYLAVEEHESLPKGERADIIFCQEILWMNADLPALANRFYRHLKDEGCIYATMGSHTHNPLWGFRKMKMEDEGIPTCSYTIDEVAQVFAGAGFAVGLRRLPVDGFLMYHPEATPANSRSLYELVQTTSECKMLFYFGKHETVLAPARLQG
jgi:SAM-dependent methyltransferase